MLEFLAHPVETVAWLINRRALHDSAVRRLQALK